MVPAHSIAEIAGRVHFERVTSSSPTFFLLSFCLPTTPFAVDLFSDGGPEKLDIMASNICFVQAAQGTPGQDFYCWRPTRLS